MEKRVIRSYVRSRHTAFHSCTKCFEFQPDCKQSVETEGSELASTGNYMGLITEGRGLHTGASVAESAVTAIVKFRVHAF